MSDRECYEVSILSFRRQKQSILRLCRPQRRVVCNYKPLRDSPQSTPRSDYVSARSLLLYCEIQTVEREHEKWLLQKSRSKTVRMVGTKISAVHEESSSKVRKVF